MYRNSASPQRSKPRPAKVSTYPICAIYTKFAPGGNQNDSTLHVNFDALPLGKLRMMATSMLGLPATTTDWSAVCKPLEDNFRALIGSAQCSSITSDPTTFIIELAVPSRAIDDVREIIINHLSDYGIPAKAFK